MTVETLDNTISYPADGAKVDFAFNFKTHEINSIKAFEDGIATARAIIVTLNANQDTTPGGSVNIADTIPAPINVTIQRIVTLDQGRDYIVGGRFPSQSHEEGLDELTFIAQQQQEELDRSLKAAIGGDPTVDYTFPVYDAGKAFLWATATKSIENSADNFNNIVTDATAQADAAAASASAASTSASSASTSETNADASETRANEWAENPEDDPVVAGEFSALHWSQKAQNAAAHIAVFTTGTGIAYAVNLGISAYVVNRIYEFIIHATNTDAATVSIDGLAVVNIALDINATETPLIPGELQINMVARVRWNGTFMILENPADNVSGIWTPVITDGTNDATSSIAYGEFVRSGRKYSISLNIVLSSKVSISGGLFIKGLPATSKNVANSDSSVYAGSGNDLLVAAGVVVSGVILPNSSSISLYQWALIAGISLLQDVHVTNITNLVMSGSYNT